jgi:hypothetical protein
MFTRTNDRPRRPGRLLGALATIMMLGVAACATDPVDHVDESTGQISPAESTEKDPSPPKGPDDGKSEACGVQLAAAQGACGDKTDPDPVIHAQVVACATAAEAAWRTCMGLPAAP